MAAPKIWSDEKKKYIQSLIPRKKILFANINSRTIAHWKEDNIDYDIIIAYEKYSDIYVACQAEYHIGFKSASFDCVSQYKTSRKIQVGYKMIANNRTQKEKVILIPCRELEEFCRHIDYYLERYNPNG